MLYLTENVDRALLH